MSGRDVLVVMPTGSGKSLCFQLPALLHPGTTLVISPLIALMKDQVDALTARGIAATYLNSTLSSDETAYRLARLRAGRYRLVYIAPERFRNERFLHALREVDLSFVAIDEAHCISQWGHDFRPDYLHLGEILQRLPSSVRILAVTATATDDIRKDIAKQLRLGEGERPPPEVFVTGFSRPNLCLNVTRVRTHREKLERVLTVIEAMKTGIIYCATRKHVERVRDLLAEHHIKALIYNGGMEDDERTRVQEAFMRRDSSVVIATNAFGMGVDRQDIRFVMHWDIPGSIEGYYQEVGRAGRDGAFAWCELLYNYADIRTQEFFIEAANPSADVVHEFYAAIRNACRQAPDGEALFTEQAWAERAGIRSTATVRNLIALFERHGLVLRCRRPDHTEPALKVPQSADLDALRCIYQALVVKEDNDRARLQSMLRYVTTRTCRHAFLLRYFGEYAGEKACSKCDICQPPRAFPPRRLPTELRTVDLQKILSCIARMHGEGDYQMVARVLRGENAKFSHLSTFGLLETLSEREIIHECLALELDGYILGMRLLPKGYDFAIGKLPPTPLFDYKAKLSTISPGNIKYEAAYGPTPPPETAHASPHSPRPTPHTSLPSPLSKEGEMPSHPQLRTSHAPRLTPHTAPLLRGNALGLHATLRQWVKEEAERRGIPTYCVLQNDTLALLAKRKPTTLSELELIPGMGAKRIAKYGEQLLHLIASLT